MTAYYPTNVKTFTTKADYTTTILAEHVNSLQDEVTALETYLGTYPYVSSGWVGAFDETTVNWPSLKERLANIEYGIHTRGIPSGGTSGQVLLKNSSTDYDAVWTTTSFLPAQTGNAGKYLTTDGSNPSWALAAATGEMISSLLLIGA